MRFIQLLYSLSSFRVVFCYRAYLQIYSYYYSPSRTVTLFVNIHKKVGVLWCFRVQLLILSLCTYCILVIGVFSGNILLQILFRLCQVHYYENTVVKEFENTYQPHSVLS